MLTEVTLARFTGSEIKFKHWLGKIEYTEGVKFLADKAQAYWLIDAVVSYQSKSLLQQYPELTEFQLWQLEVNEDKTAVLTCRADVRKNPTKWTDLNNACTNMAPRSNIPLKVCPFCSISKLDSDCEPIIVQHIKWTTFPLQSIKF